MMKYDIGPESCRICLQKSERMRSIYKPLEEGDDPPREIIRQITGLDIEEFGAFTMLPKLICKNCELSLNLASQFRAKALMSHNIIMQYNDEVYEKKDDLQETSQSPMKEEAIEYVNTQEISIDEFIVEEDINETSTEMKLEEEIESTYLFDESMEEDDKIEYLEESYLDFDSETEITLQTSEDNTMESDANHVETTVEPVVEIVNFGEESYEENSILNIEENAINKKVPKSRKESKLRQRRKNIKSNNDPADDEAPHKSIKDKKLKNMNDETGHICDICGNIYAKRGRMMDHRRRHDKELRYACELCDQRFHLRELLRKHLFMHSGGKPFKCNFCSRTFFYESVRKAHEAVHKGHKPYVCGICNKAFAYAHALKKHELIHADIKLYHCSYCRRDFRLQHHMKQHEETKLHQAAVREAESNNQTELYE